VRREEKPLGYQTAVAGLPLWTWGVVGAGLLLVFAGLLIALAIVTQKPSRAVGTPAAVPAARFTGPTHLRPLANPPVHGDPVAEALAQLKGTDGIRRGEAARRLKDILPDERRDEVVRALVPLLEDSNQLNRRAAVEALGVWGNKDAVPPLLKAMRQKETRKVAIAALGRLKDERAVEPIADRLEDFFDRRDAIQALESIGPAAEAAIIPRLHHHDREVRLAACEVLKVIGTRNSLAALEKVVAENNFFVSPKAKDAIQTITARTADSTPTTKR
jgi:HEAT repeat protein